MIRSLGNKVAKDIWETNKSKTLPRELHLRAKALLQIMNATSVLEDLKIQGQPPNIRLHKLKGDLKAYWSLTLMNTSPWRIIFKYENGEFNDVRILDYHGG